MSHAVRALDPFVQVRGRWIVRRLSPHCLRIELDELPKNRDECRLLFAMGWETANIHLGSRGALKEVRRHLETLTRQTGIRRASDDQGGEERLATLARLR